MSVLSANEQAVLASNLLSNNAYGILGNPLNISLWMGLRMNFATGRVWTDGNGLSYIPSFTDYNVYAEGLCYSLLCNPSRGCTWWGEVPALEGCTIVTRDGFICKTGGSLSTALLYCCVQSRFAAPAQLPVMLNLCNAVMLCLYANCKAQVWFKASKAVRAPAQTRNQRLPHNAPHAPAALYPSFVTLHTSLPSPAPYP